MVNIVCGDCGSADTQWASLNKGLFLCNDCSFIHRSLGPQYSRLKSLNHSKWNESLRKMVTTLAAGAANNVWEHLLLNPSKSEPQMKKPNPSDSLEVVKKRFITAKHLNFQFVLRQKAETFKERNEELHCTVRTADIGTALRLIASGADPNFFHPERGTRPLHVACRSGQALQVELLFVHGAEIDAPDYLGQTPADHAKAAGFKELAMRIEELRYHLTDQLSRFVCGEVPDHTTAKHIIIPAQTTNSFGQDERIKTLPPYMLEQLASDLYDEVDRRDAEKILLSSTADHARFSIAFLPVNQNFPSVRNQTRQKFARLTDSELSALITSILRESKRRHNGSTLLETEKDIFLDNDSLTPTSEKPSAPINGNGHVVNEDDEFPLYDSVASDDDVVMSEVHTIETHTPPANNFNSVSSCAIRNTTTTDNPFLTKLAEDRIAELETNNLGLKYELKVVRQMLTDYIQDNLERRRFSELDRLNSNTLDPEGRSPCGVVLRQHNLPSELSSHLKKFRSVSMYAEKPEDSIVRGKEDVGTLVQNTTRDIVELIKVLIEYARSGDYQGVQLTANKAYDVAQGMASSLLLCRDLDANIRSGLHNVVVKVLRMKTEVPLLSNSQLLRAAAISDDSLNLNFAQSDLYVQKIKQLCFDVGAAMKLLVSSVVPSI